MENQFIKTMSERSDDQLIRIVSSDREKYNISAIEAAENEINKRNIDQSIVQQKSEEFGFEKQLTTEVESDQASNSRRFANFLIDTIAGYIFAFIIALIITLILPFDIIGYPLMTMTLFLASFSAYYILMEVIFQKTVGKFFTKTKVVTVTGHKPREKDIILRTICRLIPFDNISFLFTKNGFHDNFSNTKVIKDN
jgi:uncharacterized RDD family membrane protein YckC